MTRPCAIERCGKETGDWLCGQHHQAWLLSKERVRHLAWAQTWDSGPLRGPARQAFLDFVMRTSAEERNAGQVEKPMSQVQDGGKTDG